MKTQKKTTKVANTRNPGVVDTTGLESLKARAVELMAQSVGQEQEHVRLEAQAGQLRSQLAEVGSLSGKARDSAAVLRLRAGGKFREIRDILKPAHGWNGWKKEIKESHRWSSTTIDEAIELWDLAKGDEAQVKGQKISHALMRLRALREQDGARTEARKEAARKAAATRKKDKERARERAEAEVARQHDSAEAKARVATAQARLAEVFGPEWDAEALGHEDVEALAGMVAAKPSPGLSRLRSAWTLATAEDREAFLLWAKGAGR